MLTFDIVVHGKLSKSAGGLEEDDVIGITGHETQQIEAFNQQDLQLGQAQMDPAFKEEVEQALKEKDQTKKQEGDNVRGNARPIG